MTWKRSGIFLIHAGIVVMMLSELITGLFAVEGAMVMFNGDAINYVTSTRHSELAFSKSVDASTDPGADSKRTV